MIQNDAFLPDNLSEWIIAISSVIAVIGGLIGFVWKIRPILSRIESLETYKVEHEKEVKELIKGGEAARSFIDKRMDLIERDVMLVNADIRGLTESYARTEERLNGIQSCVDRNTDAINHSEKAIIQKLGFIEGKLSK